MRTLQPDPESFTCPKCGMTSYNPNDVREGYCGNCHTWYPLLGSSWPPSGTSDPEK